MNTGLYPILRLLARLDVTRLSESRNYTGIQPFRQLIYRCMGAKIWKVRAMAARCLPIVLDPDTLSSDIEYCSPPSNLMRRMNYTGDYWD